MDFSLGKKRNVLLITMKCLVSFNLIGVGVLQALDLLASSILLTLTYIYFLVTIAHFTILTHALKPSVH